MPRTSIKGKGKTTKGTAAAHAQSTSASNRKSTWNAARSGMVPSFVGNMSVGSGLGSAERKVVDINEAAYALEATGTTLTLLNGCVAGSQIFNRIGRKILVRSLQIRGWIFNTDDTIFPTLVRMIVVYDKQANASAPTYANVMTSQNIAGTTSALVSSMVNLDNRDRFVILRDRLFTLGPVNNTATQAYAQGQNPIEVSEYLKLRLETIYNAGSAGTVGDITSGSLYIFWIASQAAATGATFTGSYRVRFEDV